MGCGELSILNRSCVLLRSSVLSPELSVLSVLSAKSWVVSGLIIDNTEKRAAVIAAVESKLRDRVSTRRRRVCGKAISRMVTCHKFSLFA